MDFSLSADLLELQQRTRHFIRGTVMALERDSRQTAHGITEDFRQELVALARAERLLTPHASREMGGLGLSHVAKAIIFEEAGYSPIGPVALNVHAPDEGNIHLLETVATSVQKEKWLRPLVEGRVRSFFAMTEPPPGAGSDPSMLQSIAIRDNDSFLISGRKWFVTGAQGASFGIVLSRMEDGSASMFLTDMHSNGITVERMLDTMDSCFIGGHAVLRLEGLRVRDTDVLGGIGKGFEYAQARLSPARLSHCMRWLGAAQRAHDVATNYARKRHAFGKTLLEHEGVGFMLADNEIDLYTSRLAIWHTAWMLDCARGDTRIGRWESSMTKVQVSEALWRVVDRCVQVLGGQGITDETIVARIFRDMRAFRIYDGPSEVHRWSLAKKLGKQRVAP